MFKRLFVTILVLFISVVLNAQLVLSSPFPEIPTIVADTSRSTSTMSDTNMSDTNASQGEKPQPINSDQNRQKEAPQSSRTDSSSQPAVKPANKPQPVDPYDYETIKQYSDELYGEEG